MRSYYVYILTNKWQTVLYVGVTGNLEGRIAQHKAKVHPKSFTAQYNVHRLMYFEEYDNPLEAIMREKQLKAGPRWRKERLISKNNPEWRDLSEDWFTRAGARP